MVIEIDSDNSEEVDLPFHQLELPDLPPMEAEKPNEVEQPNQVPGKEQQQNQVSIQPVDAPTTELIQPLDAPVEDPNQPNQPNNQINPKILYQIEWLIHSN